MWLNIEVLPTLFSWLPEEKEEEQIKDFVNYIRKDVKFFVGVTL